MKIIMLSDSNSPHTLRWVDSLKAYRIDIILFSFYPPDNKYFYARKNVTASSLDIPSELRMKKVSVSKLVYFKALKKVKKLIKEFKPDILHSHYASSYGLIGALTGFHPLIVSVWGADVYDFPNMSFMHKRIFKYSLNRADKILSTSSTMKNEIKKYTGKEIIITPFGIDVNRFYPQKEDGIFGKEDLVIGTVKALEKKYGIEFLVRAFQIIKRKFPDKSIKLLIVGQGTEEFKLKKLVKELNIENDTTFTGYVDHNEVQKYHNMLDIFVSASVDNSESFGVSVLEAGACEKPVIVSNVGGLPEVVENEKTGFIVDPKNSEAIAEALSRLIENPELRMKMGKNGREKVLQEYKWGDCVNKMISIYKTLLN